VNVFLGRVGGGRDGVALERSLRWIVGIGAGDYLAGCWVWEYVVNTGKRGALKRVVGGGV